MYERWCGESGVGRADGLTFGGEGFGVLGLVMGFSLSSFRVHRKGFLSQVSISQINDYPALTARLKT